ncbi:MAG: hypothetical protein M9913_13930 [Bryobacteraceae bacterium]|nr:hypothetical protein [Solibacteraceae bacterium]MCO5351974.1 hypothetical protein [Bryobacteraceae bacterium]
MNSRAQAWLLAAAVFGQAAGLWWLAHLDARSLLLGAFLAVAVHAAWRARALWSGHLDMILVMGALGGFGMLLGTWADARFAPSLVGVPCPMHTRADGGLFTWMTGLMLLFAVPPGVAWSRCLDRYRNHRPALWAAVAIDTAGMLAGMIAFGLWFADPFSLLVESGTAGMHLAMLVGMLAGMAAAMPLRDWAAERLALLLPARRLS